MNVKKTLYVMVVLEFVIRMVQNAIWNIFSELRLSFESLSEEDIYTKNLNDDEIIYI